MNLLASILISLVSVATLSLIYGLAPHKAVKSKRPRLVFFPKYKFKITDPERIREVLKQQGFISKEDSKTYIRGKHFGDFSSKWLRLNVVVHEATVYLHSPLVVILFDTGDLWEVASTLLENAEAA